MTTTGTNISSRTGLRTGGSTGKVIRGTSDATLFNLDVRHKAAVGALLDGTGKNFCTGTLVGDNTVLTAAHCIKGVSAGAIQFAIGNNSASPTRVFDVAEIRINPLWTGGPEHDNALLILYESASSYALPVPINRETLTPSYIGYQVQNVGYGATSTSSTTNTVKWWTAEPISQIENCVITVDGRQVSSVCKGDSGSPTLYRFANGSLRVLGTLHGGEVTCIGLDKYARTDADARWLMTAGGKLHSVDSPELQQAFTIPYVSVPPLPFFRKANIGLFAGLTIAGVLVGAIVGRLIRRS